MNATFRHVRYLVKFLSLWNSTLFYKTILGGAMHIASMWRPLFCTPWETGINTRSYTNVLSPYCSKLQEFALWAEIVQHWLREQVSTLVRIFLGWHRQVVLFEINYLIFKLLPLVITRINNFVFLIIFLWRSNYINYF